MRDYYSHTFANKQWKPFADIDVMKVFRTSLSKDVPLERSNGPMYLFSVIAYPNTTSEEIENGLVQKFFFFIVAKHFFAFQNEKCQKKLIFLELFIQWN